MKIKEEPLESVIKVEAEQFQSVVDVNPLKEEPSELEGASSDQLKSLEVAGYE